MNSDTCDNSKFKQILFDICIVNFNTKELTKACIDNLKNATAGMPCDIWVVDNGSTDGSIELLENMAGIRFISRSVTQPEEGHIAHAIAIDLVFSKSLKKYLILMHTDTIVYEKKAVHMLLDTIEKQPNIAAAGCLDQTYYGTIRMYFRNINKTLSFFRKTTLYKLGLRKASPKIIHPPVHIRSFFSIWNIQAMKAEGLCFNMGNKNPGYAAQDIMMSRGYLFLSIAPKELFRYLDHLEAATVAQKNPYHFKHRRSKTFRRKMRQLIG